MQSMLGYFSVAHLQEVVVAVGVVLQTQRPEGERDEQTGRHCHSPVTVTAGGVVARVTRGVDVAIGGC